MIAELQRFSHAFRNGNQEGQYQAWLALTQHISDLYSKLGKSPAAFLDAASSPKSSPAPPAASFAVAGLDGKFKVAIVNPQDVLPQTPAILMAQARAGLNRQRTPMLHNLQSSPDLNFDANSGVTDYGISSQLAYEFQDPNTTKFFRLRSSFDGQKWNDWQIYSSALTCGPLGVQSGLLRTAALTQVNAAYTPSTQPLSAATGAGVNQATIAIASFLVQYPSSIGQVSYNSGTITPLLDSTKYYVYCLDPGYAGGPQTYLASTSNPKITADEALVFLGTITTPAHGGGGTTGSGGGGGPCFSGNTLVQTQRGRIPISEIKRGDKVYSRLGWRLVGALLAHDFDGELREMGSGEMVTPDHRIWYENEWRPAGDLFPVAVRFKGRVYNLALKAKGKTDRGHCYTLGNGYVAHNVLK